MAELGQNIRVFVKKDGVPVCVAAATDCSFHVATEMSDKTTKDSAVGAVVWREQKVTGKSWDVSCNALYDPETPEEANAITPAELAKIIIESDTCEVELRWDATTGDKNREGKNIGYYGKALFNDLSIQSAVKEDNKAAFQFQGNGPLKALPEPVVPPTPEAGE